mmetsp:Transcript_36770/g.84670  ORF Transcript_36770/g.84670 Transcript_36770/m.84670 type:complete len:93 (-) Transcript_36770:1462-1740(-)
MILTSMKGVKAVGLRTRSWRELDGELELDLIQSDPDMSFHTSFGLTNIIVNQLQVPKGLPDRPLRFDATILTAAAFTSNGNSTGTKRQMTFA